MSKQRKKFISDMTKLAAEVYDKFQAKIDKEAEKLRTQAIDAARAMLEGAMDEFPIDSGELKQSMTAPAPVADLKLLTSPGVEVPEGKKPRRCSACGQTGHRADGCPKIRPDGAPPPSRANSKLTGRAREILARNAARREEQA